MVRALWNIWRSLVVGVVCITLLACQQTTISSSDKAYHFQPPSRDGIGKVYLGREIAQVMGHEGAYWLERPSRELQEHPQTVVDLLDLEPDDVVADIGAGTGYMTTRLAAEVPDGHVFAVDIQPEMVELLRARLSEEGTTVAEPILGAEDNPNLPDASLDVALMVDAYHEFEYPYEMMVHLKQALKPGGRVVLAEYRAENPMVLIKRLHKMSRSQVRREMQAVGFDWLKTDESLPQQHLFFFEKPVKSAP